MVYITFYSQFITNEITCFRVYWHNAQIQWAGGASESHKLGVLESRQNISGWTWVGFNTLKHLEVLSDEKLTGVEETTVSKIPHCPQPR